LFLISIQIYAFFRLIPEYGGDPSVYIPVAVANDTGSDIQTVFQSDLAGMHYDLGTYMGRIGMGRINTPNGVMFRERILIQIKLVDSSGAELTRWFVDTAAITPNMPGLLRLSGIAMRHHLYFATAPGNEDLYVAVQRNGITTQLPFR
jgi:hypothetical protein